ncbi:MAG: hypothetical protein DMG06_02435 [Acidobacteria bacterium]|nr:MAG: hypothetical protein DMG06_02435 [Acidobacteriota bacterium]
MPYRALGDGFVGRVEALWEVHHKLNQGKTTIVQGVGVVTGMGGLGKSQLATDYVHRFGRTYGGGVFWVDSDQDAQESLSRSVTVLVCRLTGSSPRLNSWRRCGDSSVHCCQPICPHGAHPHIGDDATAGPFTLRSSESAAFR